MTKIIRFVGGPPGTGKSLFSARIVEQIQSRVSMPVCLMDGDMFFTPQARVLMVKVSGVELDTPEFARQFNLPAQLRFQKLIRLAAEEGILVLATAPFENMFGDVGGKPLWEKMRTDDFAGFDISMTYVLLAGDEQEVEKEINRRLCARVAVSPYHGVLDAKKITDPDYYSKRAVLVRKSVETFGFPLIEAKIGEEPRAVADRLADAIIASR